MPRRRLSFRLARASLRTLALASIFIVAGVVALLRTALGHQVVLNWVVGQADARVAGTVTVAGIRSGGILSGARLYGVRLLTPAGRPFVTVDSLEMSYDVRGLVSGAVAFSDVKLWGPVVELTWTRDGDGSTLASWLGPRRGIGGDAAATGAAEGDEAGAQDGAGSDGDSGSGGLRPTLRLSDVQMVDATLRVRRPTELTPGGLVRVLPSDGGTLAMDLRMDTAHIPDLTVRPSARGGTTLGVDHLAGRLDLLREIVDLNAFQAEATIAGGRVDVEVADLQLNEGVALGDVTVFTTPDSRRLVELELDLPRVDRTGLDWLFPWMPPFQSLAMGLQGTVDRGLTRLSLEDMDARWAGAPVTGGGRVRIQRGVSLETLALRADGLPVDALDHWLPAASGKPGALRGNLVLNGPVDALGVVGRMSLVEPGRVSVSEVNGTLTRDGGGLGFRDFSVFAAPLHFSALAPWVPSLPVAGVGSAQVVLNGGPASGLRLSVDATMEDGAEQTSRVVAQGSIRTPADGWQIDVQGDAAPFQLSALRDLRPELPVDGPVTGSFRVRGSSDELAVRTEVRDSIGSLELEGTFNPAAMDEPASARGAAANFALGSYLPALGETTRLSGVVEGSVVGRGDSLSGSAFIRLGRSDIRGMVVDSVVAQARAGGGQIAVDTVRATFAGLEVDGAGTLGLAAGLTEPGTMALDIRADSLSGIRPAFLGPVVHARDTLSGLDAQILILSGVNPDTLPVTDEIAVNGSGSGHIELSGWLDRLDGEAEVLLDGFSFGEYAVQRARFAASGTDLRSDERLLRLELDTDSVRIGERGLQATRSRASSGADEVRASFFLTRSEQETYTLAGGVRVEPDGYRASVDQLDLKFDSVEFALTAPSRVVWTDSVLAVDDFELVRSGDEPVRIALSGVLPQRGEADFTMQLRNLSMARVVRLLQRDDPVSGRLDLDMSVQGPARAPLIQGFIFADQLSVGEFIADSARFNLDYADLTAAVETDAFRDGARFLEGGGTVPVDLSLRRDVSRVVQESMDLRARLDRVEVAPILALIEDLEEVQGTLSGDFTITGTLEDPVPEGLVELQNAAWTVGALGVRQQDVTGTFTLTRDGSVAVNGRARAGGPVDVSGEVRLNPLTNPELDVQLRFQGFQGVARRDVEGALSGLVSLTGRYQRPFVTGDLTVDRGVIYVEEFQRAIGVVDLTDPLFLGLVEQDDFILPQDRPLLSGIRNPFLDSLRVDVNLAVPRDTWLRSTEMNVELTGNLGVTYDRGDRDLVLVGDLLARRGQYNLYGRNFDVRGGTVAFIGIPGINPILDIQAVAPIRRRDQSRPLEVEATVEGTLIEPRVALSTQEAGYAQSDLVSYLILGRPSSEIVGAGDGTDVLGSAVVTGALGYGASELGRLAVQNLGINYLAVSQIGDLGLFGGGALDSFRSTQLEVGRYFSGGDVFGLIVVQPLSTGVNPVSGVRVEWQANAQYQLEAFVEDRFLRQGGFGLDELTRTRLYAWGAGFFREWGY